MTGLQWLSATQVESQLEAALAETQPTAVKIGMIASRSIALCVARILAQVPRDIPVVYDPVFQASADGTSLWRDRRAATARSLAPLLARVSVLTPTWREAAQLAQNPQPHDLDEAIACARGLLPHLASDATVVLKGGDAQIERPVLTDVCIQSQSTQAVTHPRKPRSMHGTGCTFARALALSLAPTVPITQSVAIAGAWVARQLDSQFPASTSQ